MSDSFREVTSVSWFGRIRRSVGGLVIGLLLVIGMVVLLFWNEGRAVQTARSLAEGAGAVVSAQADAVDPANNGKLVHVSGPVTTDSVPADPEFGISRPGIRLVRNVEMFQWKETARSETTTKLGGGEETTTTYTYSKDWDDSPIDSGSFRQPSGHSNPPMELRGRSFQISEGRLGAFTVDQPVLDRVGGDQPLAIGSDQLPSIQAAFNGTQRVSVSQGGIYLGRNPTSPAIGDYRITYETLPLGPISVIGQQDADRFQPYQTSAGDRLLMVDNGSVPADRMFADAVSANKLVTWLLRAAGLLLLLIGFSLFLAPIAVMADVIPPLGGIVRFGTGAIALILALLVGSTTMAVAWFWYRPLLAALILGGGVLAAFVASYLGKGRRVAMPAPSPTPYGRQRAQPAPAPIPAPAPSPAPQPQAQAPAPTPRPSSKWN